MGKNMADRAAVAPIDYVVLPRAFARALLSGGDERLAVQDDGLNKYGCAPRPRGAVEFGSCTSSTLSERGHLAAFSLWRELCAQPSPGTRSAFIDDRFEEVRQHLCTWLGADPSLTEVVLTPSGTDAELIALHVAASQREGRIRNVVVAPGEVGSGTILAAACRHFAELTPSGRPSTPGVAICPELASRVTTYEVEARDTTGAVRQKTEIEEQLSSLVRAASNQNETLVLHAVAHSKTGIRVPDGTALERLATLDDNVLVLVDAAQARLSKVSIQEHLSRGRMVLFTGSKFFGGPTFSGALLLPRQLADAANRPLPSGYGDYFTENEMPRSWQSARTSLDDRENVGLLLRWEAALSEMFAFDEVPANVQRDVIQLFASSVEEVFGSSDWIHLVRVDCTTPDDTTWEEASIETHSTVFNFVLELSPGQVLDKATLARWHGWLNRSLSAFLHHGLDPEQKLISDREFHLGQPVMISPGKPDEQIAVLRIALGAPLLEELAELPPPRRRERLETHLVFLRKKLEIIRSFGSELGCG